MQLLIRVAEFSVLIQVNLNKFTLFTSMSITYRAKLPEYCHLMLYNSMYVYINLLD